MIRMNTTDESTSIAGGHVLRRLSIPLCRQGNCDASRRRPSLSVSDRVPGVRTQPSRLRSVPEPLRPKLSESRVNNPEKVNARVTLAPRVRHFGRGLESSSVEARSPARQHAGRAALAAVGTTPNRRCPRDD
jgi:hypothetical protein